MSDDVQKQTTVLMVMLLWVQCKAMYPSYYY